MRSKRRPVRNWPMNPGLTRSEYLRVYAQQMIETHDWASDPLKLARHLEIAIATLNGDSGYRERWDSNGTAAVRAWVRAGGRAIVRRVTLAALKALPIGDEGVQVCYRCPDPAACKIGRKACFLTGLYQVLPGIHKAAVEIIYCGDTTRVGLTATHDGLIAELDRLIANCSLSETELDAIDRWLFARSDSDMRQICNGLKAVSDQLLSNAPPHTADLIDRMFVDLA